jgi:hypothetical protein
MVLQVDDFENVLKSVSVAYGQRQRLTKLQGDDKLSQERLLMTYSESDLTNAVDAADDYRTPLPAERRTYEITGLSPDNTLEPYFDDTSSFKFANMVGVSSTIFYDAF